MSTFNTLLKTRTQTLKSCLCVGLDPDPKLIPTGYDNSASGAVDFLTDVIRATADIAVAYKPNLAFFEHYGDSGWRAFGDVIDVIRKYSPDAMIIADAKRGDIGNTARFYAKTFFETYQCDGVTVSPYMGMDSVEPFIENHRKGAIVLCLTSNSGALHFQTEGERPLYLKVAIKSAELNLINDNVALVVGATRDPLPIQAIRKAAPDLPFLIPGIGTQGGDMSMVMKAAAPHTLINASRSILYASKSSTSTQEASRNAALSMIQEMRTFYK